MSKGILYKFVTSVKFTTVLYSVMLFMGGMFIAVHLYTVLGYTSLLIEHDITSRSTVVQALVQDRLGHHHYQKTLKVAAEMARDPLLKRPLIEGNRQEIFRYLNDPVTQAVYSKSGLEILDIQILSKDFELLAIWQSDAHAPVSWQKFIMRQNNRPSTGAPKVRSNFFIADDGQPVHWLVFPVGRVKVYGFLGIITSPLASLAGLGLAVGANIDIKNMAGQLLMSEPTGAGVAGRGTEEDGGTFSLMDIPISLTDGEPFLNVVVHYTTGVPITEGDRLNLVTLLVVISVTLLCLYGMVQIFKLGLVSRIRELSQTLAKITAGNTDVQIPLAQNDELSGLRQQFVMIAANAQDRTCLREELVVARQAADVSSRAKSDFLTNMSHELRTPLNAIIGFSDIMAGDYLTGNLNDKYREYSNDIRDSGIQLLNIINDILDLSRIESGNVELTIEEVEISEVIGKSIRYVEGLAKGKSIPIENRTSDQLPLIYVDEHMVHQMVVHLLSNAMKFTPFGGNIMINAGVEKDGTFCIMVVDDGIGIAEDQVDKVVSPFCQVSNSYAREFEGSGLGLTLVKAFMELHGGQLNLQSRYGVGTSVYLLFPESCRMPEQTVQKDEKITQFPLRSRSR